MRLTLEETQQLIQSTAALFHYPVDVEVYDEDCLRIDLEDFKFYFRVTDRVGAARSFAIELEYCSFAGNAWEPPEYSGRELYIGTSLAEAIAIMLAFRRMEGMRNHIENRLCLMESEIESRELIEENQTRRDN